MLISKEAFLQMFPTKTHLLIFNLYMLMFVAQGLLVTASRHGSSVYQYNYTTVVMLTETLKLILSATVYLREHSFKSLLDAIIRYRWVMVLYLTPATLYCLYNNLAFVNLATFDPTTYFMLLQLRLLLCGVIYQILFKRQLSPKQWLSLVLLTAGCMLKGLDNESPAKTTEETATTETTKSMMTYTTGLVFMLIQVLCSSIAGVYNEYLIKGEGADVHIMVQNVFMYLDSILCNVILLGLKGEFLSAFTPEAIGSIMQGLVLIIIVNNAILGIVTSLFLKNLNSVIKSFAAALELVLTAVLSVPILGIPIHFYTVTALVVICSAVVLYANNPVKQTPVKEGKSEKSSPVTDITEVKIVSNT